MTPRAFLHLHQHVMALYHSVEAQLMRPDTSHPVFHGSTDWHSAVHGHWALLWLARQMGDTERIQFIVERLSGAHFAQEFDTLRQNPEFELPYGRAWLLRLGGLFERVSGSQQHRDELQECASGLEGWLESANNPNAAEYANPCWVAIQLHAWYAHIGHQEGLQRIQSWALDHREAFTGAPEQDATHPEFFSRWALQTVLIEKVLGAEATQKHLRNLDPSAVLPVSNLINAHHLGVNACRAWGCAAAFMATQNDLWRHGFQQHLLASLALHKKWKHDHYAYTHWVPQFTVYALAISAPFEGWDMGVADPICPQKVKI